MYRYLCQLCYTMVTYGERHPCFFYKDVDNMYSLPEPLENGNSGLDEESERLPGNVNESFYNQYPSTHQSEQQCRRLAESDEHDGNTSDTKISGSLENVPSPFMHSTQKKPTNFRNSTESLKPIHRMQSGLCGAAKRKSRPKKMVQDQNDGSVNEDVSYDPESSGKCGVSNDTRLYNISLDGNLPSSLTLKSYTKGRKLNPEDNCQASISIPRVVSLKEFEGGNAITIADSQNSTGSPILPELTSNVLSASGPSTSTFEDSRHFMKGSSRVSGNSSVNIQFMKDPVKGKYICDVCHKEYDYKSQLVIHYRKHTGERPFVCNVCSKTFFHKKDLKSHYRLHTGEKEFKCDVCGTSFSYKYQLTSHLDTHKSENY